MTPPNGVHPNIPAAEYHQWRALSRSILEAGRKSMSHLKLRLDTPRADTPALLLGRAVHAAVLEPEEFQDKYGFVNADRRTKAGKELWERAVAKYGVEYVLKESDYNLCTSMRDGVWNCETARGLLGSEGDTELSLVWSDAESALTCKARYDRVSWKIAGGTVVDYKTTRDASRDAFERAIFAYGYHRQAGMYREAARACGVSLKHYAIIAQEKEPPYAVAVYRLADAAIDAGWEQIRPILKDAAYCTASGVWPGYTDEVEDITLPSWAWDRIEYEGVLS